MNDLSSKDVLAKLLSWRAFRTPLRLTVTKGFDETQSGDATVEFVADRGFVNVAWGGNPHFILSLDLVADIVISDDLLQFTVGDVRYVFQGRPRA